MILRGPNTPGTTLSLTTGSRTGSGATTGCFLPRLRNCVVKGGGPPHSTQCRHGKEPRHVLRRPMLPSTHPKLGLEGLGGGVDVGAALGKALGQRGQGGDVLHSLGQDLQEGAADQVVHQRGALPEFWGKGAGLVQCRVGGTRA